MRKDSTNSMKRVEHTPGPWRVGIEDECCIPIEWLDSEPGRPGEQYEVATVAYFDGFPPGERGEANARLIAAAPELLEALELAVATIDRLGGQRGPFKSWQGALDVALAVIAKARGQ